MRHPGVSAASMHALLTKYYSPPVQLGFTDMSSEVIACQAAVTVIIQLICHDRETLLNR